MRVSIVAAVILGVASVGVAAAQPSGPLERGIRLYDKKDYLTATVELKRVIDRETGDDAANVQRAEFFLGKALFLTQLTVPALATFERIAHNDQHAWREPSIKWIAVALDLLPDVGSGVFAGYDPAAADRPVVDPKVRDAFRYHRGAHLARSGGPGGAEMLAQIGDASEYRARAALVLAELRFGARDTHGGHAELQVAARDPRFADDAARILLRWARTLELGDRTRDALAGLGPHGALVHIETARLGVERKGAQLAGVSHDGFAAIAVAARCTVGGSFASAVASTDRVLAKLRELDDHVEVYEAVHRMPRDPAIAFALADRPVREAIGFVDELERELALVSRLDRAWQTTPIASEVLQELTVQLSVARADAGKLIAQRLDGLRADLAPLAAFGATPLAGQLALPDAVCRAPAIAA
ncbi:MAG: hypothetical protein KF773_41180, partial [Deltaproteobacteria bacterium]|nr:hypothetical protein [Deltaproteobacteria bacterium]